MRVLIVNDDGFYASGISILKDAIQKSTFASEIWVVAPNVDIEGLGASVTRNREIEIKKINQREYIVNGSPADCVVLAQKVIINEKIDLVLSGINNGSNVGSNVLSSGTVAAALTGSLLKIPSIAFSQLRNSNFPNPNSIIWTNSKKYCLKVTEMLIGNYELSSNYILNINFPLNFCNGKTIFVTNEGYNLDHSIQIKEISKDHKYIMYATNEGKKLKIIDMLYKGYVTITPLVNILTEQSNYFQEASTFNLD